MVNTEKTRAKHLTTSRLNIRITGNVIVPTTPTQLQTRRGTSVAARVWRWRYRVSFVERTYPQSLRIPTDDIHRNNTSPFHTHYVRLSLYNWYVRRLALCEAGRSHQNCAGHVQWNNGCLPDQVANCFHNSTVPEQETKKIGR